MPTEYYPFFPICKALNEEETVPKNITPRSMEVKVKLLLVHSSTIQMFTQSVRCRISQNIIKITINIVIVYVAYTTHADFQTLHVWPVDHCYCCH